MLVFAPLGLIISLVLFSGAAFGLGALLVSVGIFFSQDQGLSFSDWVLLLSLVLAFPLTAYLIGVILGRFGSLHETGVGIDDRVFVKFATLFTVALMLQTDLSVTIIFSLADRLLGGSIAEVLAAWLSLGNATVFCVVVGSVGVITPVVLFELSYRWFLSASGDIRFAPLVSSFRLLILILVLSISLQLCIGLFVNELSPRAWLGT